LENLDALETVDVPNSLDPQQPWKLSFEIGPIRSFPELDLFTFTNLPIWNLGVRRPSGLSASVQGTTVEIRHLTTGMVDVELPGKPPDRRLTLVSVLDDQNRDLTMTVSGLHHESFIATAFLRLFDNPRSKSLNLTVAVSKIINAEFIAQPAPPNPH